MTKYAREISIKPIHATVIIT